MKVKVYIMHSEKVNYKENIYKPLLKRNLRKGKEIPLTVKKTPYIIIGRAKKRLLFLCAKKHWL